MEEANTRITRALVSEEAHAELIANRIRLILFAIFTVIAAANIGFIDATTSFINFGALLIGFAYGAAVYFFMRRVGYRPLMKYVTTFLDVLLVHVVLFVYTRMDVPSVGLKNYVFMIVFPVIALTVFRYDPKFTWLTGSFTVALYLLLFSYLFATQSITFDKGYNSELFTDKVTVIGQLTKVLILCGFTVIAAYLAKYTRGVLVKLVSSETTVRIEKESMERELELASQVQARLLPNEYPSIKGVRVFGKVVAGRFVGGDYFDFLTMLDQSLLVVVADVSGHGVSAALIMAEVRASVHLLVNSGNGLLAMVKNFNSLLFKSTARKDYVTLFVGALNVKKGVLEYINAGHPPPLLVLGTRTLSLPGRTLGLGLVPRLPGLKIRRMKFKPGGSLVCYTDGITERTNLTGEQYGEGRLCAFIEGHAGLDPKEFADLLLEDVKVFGARKQFEDDVTVAIVKRS